jgi:hypothetical protein
LLAASGVGGDTFGRASRQSKILLPYGNVEIEAASDFSTAVQFGTIDGKSAGEEALKEFTSALGSEFALYPPGLIERLRLKRILLCRELSLHGKSVGGIADVENGTIYLDLAATGALRRFVIHHELFHFIDYRDDGSLVHDVHWEALNPPGVRYRTSERWAMMFTAKLPGFLTYHSTTSVTEDKADVFASMVVYPSYVQSRVKEDRALESKVAYVEKMVNSSLPSINEEFWEEVRRREVSEEASLRRARTARCAALLAGIFLWSVVGAAALRKVPRQLRNSRVSGVLVLAATFLPAAAILATATLLLGVRREMGEWQDPDPFKVIDGTLVHEPRHIPEDIALHLAVTRVLFGLALVSIAIYGPILVAYAWKRQVPWPRAAVYGVSYLLILVVWLGDVGGVVALLLAPVR